MQEHPPTGQGGIGSGNEWCPHLENRREREKTGTGGLCSPKPKHAVSAENSNQSLAIFHAIIFWYRILS